MKSEEELFIPTGNVFFEQIENLVWMDDITYTEAVIVWCDQHGIEPETAGIIIKKNPHLKARIQEEAEALHFLPKEARLPI